MLIFTEGGKPENPKKNPRSKGENQQQTQLTYDTKSGNLLLSHTLYENLLNNVISLINCLVMVQVLKGLIFRTFFIWLHLEKLQEKAFNLIGNAYTSIKADDFVVYMGMPRDSAIEGKITFDTFINGHHHWSLSLVKLSLPPGWLSWL
jgi:hypothetical protein